MERSSLGARECHELRNYIAKQLKQERWLHLGRKVKILCFSKVLFSIVFGKPCGLLHPRYSCRHALFRRHRHTIRSSSHSLIIAIAICSQNLFFIPITSAIHVTSICLCQQALLPASSVFSLSYPVFRRFCCTTTTSHSLVIAIILLLPSSSFVAYVLDILQHTCLYGCHISSPSYILVSYRSSSLSSSAVVISSYINVTLQYDTNHVKARRSSLWRGRYCHEALS
jgi:hypothetical protein